MHDLILPQNNKKKQTNNQKKNHHQRTSPHLHTCCILDLLYCSSSVNAMPMLSPICCFVNQCCFLKVNLPLLWQHIFPFLYIVFSGLILGNKSIGKSMILAVVYIYSHIYLELIKHKRNFNHSNCPKVSPILFNLYFQHCEKYSQLMQTFEYI